MTLKEYIRKRNGVPLGSPKSLRNNLYRSLGAKNFSTFWNYWNPIFGYYLGKFIFKPLKKIFPSTVSLVLTFVVNGLIHDAVTTVYRGKVSVFFTVWFLLMAIAVLITNSLNHDYSKQVWIVRTLINVSIITICFLLTLYFTKQLMLR